MRKLLEFHRSPNSVKVRVALHAKGLGFETEEMSADHRAPMIEAAGWPLTPVLLDGAVVMRDSAAILHYLEANYQEGTSLTPAGLEDLRTAERIVTSLTPELQAAQWRLRPEIAKPEGERDGELIARARDELIAALARLEERLSSRSWLVGDAMSIYDIILACNLLPTRPPSRFIAQSPMWRFFDQHLRIDQERPAVTDWVDRVIAHDRDPDREY